VVALGLQAFVDITSVAHMGTKSEGLTECFRAWKSTYYYYVPANRSSVLSKDRSKPIALGPRRKWNALYGLES